MANHHLHFSTAINHLTATERTWLQRQLDRELLEAAATYQHACDELHALPEPEREAAHHQARAHYLAASPEGIEPSALVLLEHHRQHDGVLGFEHAFGHDQRDRPCLWLFAEEHGDPEPVVNLLQAFVRRFRPDARLGLTWAATCSKPRAGAFTGGGVVITAERCDWMETGDWVEQRVRGITSQACQRQLAALRHWALEAIRQHLGTLTGCRVDLDEAGEAVDLGEPAPAHDHPPQLRVIALGADGRLQASVYHPIDVNEESWDATELEEHLSAEDAVGLLQAVERAIAPDAA